MPRIYTPKEFSYLILFALALITVTEISCKSANQIKSTNETYLKNIALDLIDSRLSDFCKTERRNDTLYYPTISNGVNHYSAALVIDSLVEYESNSKLLAVMRVFSTSNQPPFSNDSTVWNAVADLGSGRGYQVTLALASISINEGNFELDWIKLDCGDFGEYFHLPAWTLHEFKDENETLCWGAFVMSNYSTRMGFGHREVVVIDLGGPNHLEITLRHSARSEGVFFSESATDDISLMQEELGKVYNMELNYLEKHYSADLDYAFDNRKIILTESSKNWYAEKIHIKGGSFVIDTTTYNSTKIIEYELLHWPAGYTLVTP